MARFGTGTLCDLPTSFKRILPRWTERVAEIVDGGDFVLGEAVARLEARLASHFGARHCVTVANGTDAIKLSLIAAGVTSRSLVLCPSFTFQACGNAVLDTPASLAFTDVDLATMVVSPEELERALSSIRRERFDRLFLLGVDLFGLPCATTELKRTCARNDVNLIVDAAQSLGATIDGLHTVSSVGMAATSFFPSKPLGAMGDGGAVFCTDEAIANTLRCLRNHGVQDYGLLAVRAGFNSRLDSFNAVALDLLLDYERGDCAARRRMADVYSTLFGASGIETQSVPVGRESACSTLTVRMKERRDDVVKLFRNAGIACQVFYRYPLHRHPAYTCAVNVKSSFANSDELARTALSLPIHPFANDDFFESVKAVVNGLPASH